METESSTKKRRREESTGEVTSLPTAELAINQFALTDYQQALHNEMFLRQRLNQLVHENEMLRDMIDRTAEQATRERLTRQIQGVQEEGRAVESELANLQQQIFEFQEREKAFRQQLETLLNRIRQEYTHYAQFWNASTPDTFIQPISSAITSAKLYYLVFTDNIDQFTKVLQGLSSKLIDQWYTIPLENRRDNATKTLTQLSNIPLHGQEQMVNEFQIMLQNIITAQDNTLAMINNIKDRKQFGFESRQILYSKNKDWYNAASNILQTSSDYDILVHSFLTHLKDEDLSIPKNPDNVIYSIVSYNVQNILLNIAVDIYNRMAPEGRPLDPIIIQMSNVTNYPMTPQSNDMDFANMILLLLPFNTETFGIYMDFMAKGDVDEASINNNINEKLDEINARIIPTVGIVMDSDDSLLVKISKYLSIVYPPWNTLTITGETGVPIPMEKQY